MSSRAEVRFPKRLEEAIRRHAEEAYPTEACGAIFGEGDGATSSWSAVAVSAAPNEHGDDRRRRYLVPPEFQVRAEKEARAAGRDVLGYYHSHPDHPAQPSEYDREHAWFGYLYLICAVQAGRSTDLHAFTLEADGGQFVDVAIRGNDVDPSA